MDYRTKRIEELKHYVVETYKMLPKECRTMPMSKFSDFLSDEAMRLVKRHENFLNKREESIEDIKKDTSRGIDFSHLREYINTLVDMGELNFDESLPLEGIVKLIKEK